jgi:hypothetical protein
MHVTLACPSSWYDKDYGDIDQTVDLPDDVAQRLLAEGYARLPDNVASLPVAEVEQVAAVEGVDLSDARTAAEKKAAVKAARNQEG